MGRKPHLQELIGYNSTAKRMRQTIDHLILVPGHAPFKDSVETVPTDTAQDEHWVLQSFQQGEPLYYIEHIRSGVEELAHTPNGLLLFSGGRTRAEGGHWSEASTYAAIAEHNRYWANDQSRLQELTARIALEEYARDSFENLLCGLYRFYQLLGKYPVHITVVGWQFKAERFQFHAKTLGIPPECFTYIGRNNPVDAEGTTAGEARALAQFQADPEGAHSPLAEKRQERNPFGLPDPYTDCPPIHIERP